MVALGTPHFSLSEFERRCRSFGRSIKPGLDFYVSTSRYIRDMPRESGWIAELEKSGATVIADTCTYYSPAVRRCRGRIMTNAAKWAYYAPGMLGVEVAFGSLAECVESAVRGRGMARSAAVDATVSHDTRAFSTKARPKAMSWLSTRP